MGGLAPQEGEQCRDQQRDGVGAAPLRPTLQGLLVGLVRGGRALRSGQRAGGQGGAAGAHGVQVSRELRLPGLLSQGLPDGCCVPWTTSQGRVGADMKLVPGPVRNQNKRRCWCRNVMGAALWAFVKSCFRASFRLENKTI